MYFTGKIEQLNSREFLIKDHGIIFKVRNQEDVWIIKYLKLWSSLKKDVTIWMAGDILLGAKL